MSNELNSCATCKRLHGRPLEQQMADLPNDRMEETAPFNKYKCQIAILHLNKFEGKIGPKGAFFPHSKLRMYLLLKLHM